MCGAALLALVLAIGLPASGDAQVERRFDLESRGGFSVGGNELGDVTDIGAMGGVGFGYRFHPNWAVRLDGDVELLQSATDGSGTRFPDMTLYSGTAGIEVSLPKPSDQDVPLNTRLHVGFGVTRMDAEDPPSTPVASFAETYFSTTGGIKIGYQISDLVSIFGSGQARLIVADEDDTAGFAAISPEVDPFGNVWSFPVTLGARFSLR